MSSLMDAARAEAQSQAGASKPATAGSDKPKKSQGAEYQRKQKQERYQFGLALQAFLQKNPQVWQQLQADAVLKTGMEKLTREPGTGQSFGGLQTPLIYRLFGDTPKVGQKITALEVFQKTRKGYNEFKQQCKKWADKNVAIVEYDEKTDAANPAYVIKEIKTLPPKQVTAADES